MTENNDGVLEKEILEEAADNTDISNEDVNEDTEQTTKEAAENVDADMEVGADEVKKKEKKGFFKKNDKDEKIKKLEDEVAELKDKYTRQLAEFENFRKRNEAEKNRMYDIGARDVIEKILPVVDSFDRGMAGIDEDTEDAFIKGMVQVYKQMNTTLADLKVETIPAVGEEFNPDFHNAVMQIEDENIESNIIVEELMKGYKYKDIIVRYSMVKVAK